MNQIAKALKQLSTPKPVPIIFYTKDSGGWLNMLADSQCDGVGLDWKTDIGNARVAVGSKVALQGNLDPMLLYAPANAIDQAVKKIIESYGDYPGHIFNLGHGIDQHTPIESVEALVAAVRRYSTKSKADNETKVTSE